MFKRLKLSKKIKLIVSDFDGVFTDGGIFIDEDFKITKKISFKDVMGVSQALKNDFKVVLISGEKSKAVDFLVQKFTRLEAYQGERIKLLVLKQLYEKYDVTPEETLYIGDDVNDIDCLNHVSTPITVPNANPKVKKVKNVQITSSRGGDGAFREVVDKLLSINKL